MTPTEVDRALNLGCKHMKFFPAEPAGGVAMLKALAGPFAHTGVKFLPTGGINAATLPDYLALAASRRGRRLVDGRNASSSPKRPWGKSRR